MSDSEFTAAMMAAFMCGDQAQLVHLCKTTTVTCECGHTVSALSAVQQFSTANDIVANCPGCGKQWITLAGHRPTDTG